MVKFVFFIVFLIGFTITMWENTKNTVSIKFLGTQIFDNAPVLLVILTSILIGMLIVLPFLWFNKFKSKQKKSTKKNSKDSKKSIDDNISLPSE